jgi:hypothetical protein
VKCISSPALDNVEVMSYVEGEAGDDVVAHIQGCLFCREKASWWTHLQNRLQKQLYRIECPTPMKLGEYRLRLLPDPQRLMVVQHLRGCPLCRREVAVLEDFLTDPGEEVGILDAVKVIVARLISQEGGIDAHLSMALRGEAEGPLILEANGIVISLDFQPDMKGEVSMLGLLAAENQENWNGAVVQLQQAETLLTSSVDDLGAFNFEAVPPGSMHITITSPQGTVIKTPDIDTKV